MQTSFIAWTVRHDIQYVYRIRENIEFNPNAFEITGDIIIYVFQASWQECIQSVGQDHSSFAEWLLPQVYPYAQNQRISI